MTTGEDSHLHTPHPHVFSISPSVSADDYYSNSNGNAGQYPHDQHHHHHRQHKSHDPDQPPESQSGPLQHRLSYLGFIEFPLPDGGVYYIHATRRVVVDADLRKPGKADQINKYLNAGFATGVWNQRTGSAEPGWELWLREIRGESDKKKKKDAGKGKKGKKAKTKGKGRAIDSGDETSQEEPIRFEKYWVEHKNRRVFVDPETGNGQPRGTIDDALDAEYRYWSYMEDHPAHTSLPSNARKDAMDILNWTWSDGSMKSVDGRTAPFSQAECKHLLDHLKSLGDIREDPSNSGLQSFVHTRVVARVLLRFTQWRQATFRPHKPFPQDVAQTKRYVVHPIPSTPFYKRIVDFVLSLVFLGVPYIFMNRMHPHRFLDEEGGATNVLKGAAVPMLVIGACTCLVAAIILSASVTFLSLPGLDAISRVVGLVAALLATFSMIATVVAVFKYKSDLERSFTSLAFSGYAPGYGTFPAIGTSGAGEGMLVHSRRIVILSLPLTLLIYSVIAFVTGIVLYSFFGQVTDAQPGSGGTLQQHFEKYTQWSVVGVVGGLAGVLVTAMLMLRK
ncbi:hypothetical protein L218DRAFT_550583 [Marasmius fiardii PR-910]|nr:hypothetical protein L218DRAFT_550583 [Marasmius fiardii PR-910]